MPQPLRPPTLKLHKATGQWYVRYAGKCHYLGKHKAAAERQLPAEITKWAAWAQGRTDKRPVNATSRTLGDVALEWLELKATDVGEEAMRDARTFIARFLAAWGHIPCIEVVAPRVNPTAWLNALKSDMKDQGFKPRTINKTIRTAKALLHYGADMGYLPQFNLRQARGLPLGAKRRIDRTIDDVIAFIVTCENADARLYPWLRIAYLTACRPKELVAMMKREGRWEQETAHRGGAVWRCANKVAYRTGDDRYISLTSHALALLREGWSLREAAGVAPNGARQNAVQSQSGLQQYVRTAAQRSPTGGVGGLHFLRHSAATHLGQQGVQAEDIDLALGHWPPGEWRSYAREDWRRSLEVLARVTLPPRGSREESAAVARSASLLSQREGRDLRQQHP